LGKGRRDRYRKHISVAKNGESGEHYKNEYKYLHRAIKKYGIDNFNIFIYAVCKNEEEAYLAEEEWIDRMKEAGVEVYNLANGGKGGHTGLKRSEETKRKMSEALKEFWSDKDHPLKGQKLSDEVRENMSKGAMGKAGTNTGKIYDEEWRLNIAKGNAGKDYIGRRKFTEEVEQEICRLYIEGKSFYKLGQEFACNRSLIITIIDRHNIEHRPTNNKKHKNIFTAEQELEICRKYKNGTYTIIKLAKEYKCGRTTVRSILVRHNIIAP
jgi:group I intron endonuclease